MSKPEKTPVPAVIPVLRYADALKAIDWLTRAFAFSKHAVYADGAQVHHAQLTYGKAMVMLGSARDDAFGKHLKPPQTPTSVVTQSVYVVVPDPDAHHAAAVAAGAKVVEPLRDEDYGGRGYSCRDPEGNLWTFGSYDPWAA